MAEGDGADSAGSTSQSQHKPAATPQEVRGAAPSYCPWCWAQKRWKPLGRQAAALGISVQQIAQVYSSQGLQLC